MFNNTKRTLTLNQLRDSRIRVIAQIKKLSEKEKLNHQEFELLEECKMFLNVIDVMREKLGKCPRTIMCTGKRKFDLQMSWATAQQKTAEAIGGK